MLEQKEISHNEATTEQEQQLRHFARELGAECEHLYVLLEQSGGKQSAVKLPPRYTVLLRRRRGLEISVCFKDNMYHV